MHDVVIVGGGGTGSISARVLAATGLDVLMLEAGPPFVMPDEPTDSSGAPPSVRVDPTDHPFTIESGSDYEWWRVRALGGRMNVWSRVCLRLSEHELQSNARDGLAPDWPVTFEELDPYYARAERVLRVQGSPSTAPHLPMGDFVRSSLPRPIARLRDIVAREWPHRHVLELRWSGAVGGIDLVEQRRPNMRIRPNTIVERVLVGTDGLATGVQVVDRLTKERSQVSARAVVLGASTLETVRILLNSDLPDRSGQLGRNVMDHTMTRISGSTSTGLATELVRRGTHPFLLADSAYLLPAATSTRGFGLQGYLREGNGAVALWLVGFGETLPRAENRVTLRRDVLDAWGIPCLHFDVRYVPEDLQVFERLTVAATEFATLLGFGEQLDVKGLHCPGTSIHEVGGARMGSTPEVSVVNPFGQHWSAPNLVIADGAAFVTSGCQNPTLTMLALAIRACERLSFQLHADTFVA